MTCDDVLVARLAGDVSDAAAAHVAACAACRADAGTVTAVRAALRAGAPPGPSPALTARVLRETAPLLVRRARPAWRAVARGLAVALAALPLVLAVDVGLLRLVHAVADALLPAPLGAVVTAQYAVLLALLLGLGYAAVPLIAAHQHRPEDAHA
jgi:hypothetical protein